MLYLLHESEEIRLLFVSRVSNDFPFFPFAAFAALRLSVEVLQNILKKVLRKRLLILSMLGKLYSVKLCMASNAWRNILVQHFCWRILKNVKRYNDKSNKCKGDYANPPRDN